jgi:hypothetical protein
MNFFTEDDDLFYLSLSAFQRKPISLLRSNFMKIIKALSLAPLLLSSMVFGEQAYQAPQLKVKDFKASEVSDQQSDWRSMHYRVQDKPMADRALASDPDWVDPGQQEQSDVARDPSSVGETATPAEGLTPWRFYPKD